MLTRRSFLAALPALYAVTRRRAYARAAAPSLNEFHVSPSGSDHNDGSRAHPFRTIGAAAQHAHAGDTITVHEGIYRERVAPPRGGISDAKRITYQAAEGERVEITGAETLTDWRHVRGRVWKAVLPNRYFGSFNPYKDILRGDWFNPLGRVHHTGAVYRRDIWFEEAASLDDVFAKPPTIPLWFSQVDDENTTLWAQFESGNPNDGHTEINVRQTVFYPARSGVNYLTVRGFIVRRAATPWAPPTAEQIGAIGTHWSKGWIIENNDVSYSLCSGIALGKYGDQWDNTAQNSAQGYIKTIERALHHGWSKRNIGHHIVRNNTISHCEQTAVVGIAGFHDNPSGDMRFYNNLFARKGDLSPFDHTRLPVELGGNVFLKGTKPCAREANPLVLPNYDPTIDFAASGPSPHLAITLDGNWAAARHRPLVTTQLLGRAVIPNLPFVQPDLAPIVIDRDYLGHPRNRANPFPGPLECPEGGGQRVPAIIHSALNS